jgi:5-hydroxyisourate hydrolase-like protein (transthyretin family)
MRWPGLPYPIVIAEHFLRLVRPNAWAADRTRDERRAVMKRSAAMGLLMINCIACIAAGTDSKGPVLRGRVVDEAGRPLPNVRVVLYGGVATRLRGQETQTDADGRYRFDPLSTGAMILPETGGGQYETGVQVEHDSYVPADGQSWRDIQVPIVDRHEVVLDITMVLGGRIRGVVADSETGRPAPNLDLRIQNGFLNGEKESTFLVYVTTDSEGRFESAPLFPDRYVIEINDHAFQGKYRYPRIGKADVARAQTTEVQLTTRERPDLQDPFTITGTAKATDGKK